ncbi:hypothetical protein ABT063_43495 [Streptomyces sp. NPDC002838]|uniref:hypothetical protein n=1 Tax=Streptomyces sp. NPDC002838 TaxID=3154436 RepID=UPI003329E582
MKRSLIRVAIAGALTAPVLLMASGVASADSSSYGTSADFPGAYTERACPKAYTDDKGSEHYGDKHEHKKYGHDKHEYDKHDKHVKHEYDKHDKYEHDKHEHDKGHYRHGLLGGLLGL